MTVSNGDIVRAAARLRTASGDDIVNVFTYKYDGGGMALDSFADFISVGIDELYQNIQPSIPSDVSFVDIDVMDLTTGEVTGAKPWPTLTVGGGTGDTAPQQCCGLVLGTTAASHTMARKFLGPFIKSGLGDGVWGSTVAAQLADFTAAFILPVAIGLLGEATPVVAQIVNNAVTRVTDILGTFSNNGVYTQRRRKPGVGA